MVTMQACPRCYEYAVVSNAFGRRCVRCGWTRLAANQPKERRRRRVRNTSAVGPYRLHRAPVEKPWEPLTAGKEANEQTDKEPIVDGELSLLAPEPVEVWRVDEVYGLVTSALLVEGRLTRDGLCELLGIAKETIVPRVGELIASGHVRETAHEALTRAGNRAKLLELVR